MKIVQIPVAEIQRDTSRFQFRLKDFDPSRVDFLVQNWDESILDPLDLWEQENGERALLAGHHRLEAAIRVGIATVPCRIHKVSEAKARTVALLSNSNRLEYTAFEKSGCLEYLVNTDGLTLAEAARQMNLSPGMAKKFYVLRHLKKTEWEAQSEGMDLLPLAFEVGLFCDQNKLKIPELNSLFKVVVKHKLSVPQLQQLFRDIKKYRSPKATQGVLFDLSDESITDRVVGSVKQRSALNNVATYTWFLYELVKAEGEYSIPEDIKTPLIKNLRMLYAHCIGSDKAEETPKRSTKEGRKLKINLTDPNA
jgi:hypothetical protein